MGRGRQSGLSRQYCFPCNSQHGSPNKTPTSTSEPVDLPLVAASTSLLSLFTSFFTRNLSASSLRAKPPTDNWSSLSFRGRSKLPSAGDGRAELEGEGEELGVGDGLRRVRLSEGTVEDLNPGEGETPGRASDRLGEPPEVLGPAKGVVLAKPKPREADGLAVLLSDGRDGVPNARGEGEEGRPKPKERGDGRGADGKGSE